MRVRSDSHLTRRSMLGLLGGAIVALGAACQTPAAPTTPANPTASTSSPAAAPKTNPAASAPTPSTAAPTVVPREVTLRLGLPTSLLMQSPLYVAADKGFFAEERLTVEWTNHEADALALKAVAGGALDVVDNANSLGQLLAIDGGAELQMIGATVFNPFMFAAKEDIKSLKDIEGRIFATSAPGGITDLLPRVAFIQHGADLERIEFINIGGSGAKTQALLAGKVDAGLISLEFQPTIEAEPGFHVFANARELLPNFVVGTVAAHQKFIRDNPDALTRYWKGMIRGTRFVNDPKNKDEVIDLIASRIQLKELERAYELYKASKVWIDDGRVSSESLDYLQQTNVEYGGQQAKIPMDRLYNGRFVEEANASLAG